MLEFLKNLPFLRRLYYVSKAPLKVVRFHADLGHAIEVNRDTLALIPRWLDEDVYQASIFHYGLPPQIRAFIDDPIDRSPTYTDLIVHLATRVDALRYLELGPSVGKNFFQVARAVDNAELVAVDIETINPTLEKQFQMVDRVEWPTMAGSKRTGSSSKSSYTLASNRIQYIAGDLFDSATWDRLAGRKFDLIFSDAFHSPDALLMEWENISRLGLMSDGAFAMVWDDLTNEEMRGAFYKIATAIRRTRPSASVSLELFQGWVGKRERLHPIGLVIVPG
jgi:hypothetical protein